MALSGWPPAYVIIEHLTARTSLGRVRGPEFLIASTDRIPGSPITQLGLHRDDRRPGVPSRERSCHPYGSFRPLRHRVEPPPGWFATVGNSAPDSARRPTMKTARNSSTGFPRGHAPLHSGVRAHSPEETHWSTFWTTVPTMRAGRPQPPAPRVGHEQTSSHPRWGPVLAWT